MGKVPKMKKRNYDLRIWPFVSVFDTYTSRSKCVKEYLSNVKHSEGYHKIKHLLPRKNQGTFPCGFLDDWTIEEMIILLRCLWNRCKSLKREENMLSDLLPNRSIASCHDACDLLLKQLKPPTLKQSLSYAKVYLLRQRPKEEVYKFQMQHNIVQDLPLNAQSLLFFDVRKLIGGIPDRDTYCRLSILRYDVFSHYITKSESERNEFLCRLADFMRKNPDLYPFKKEISLQ